ncbi:Penicillin-binding protein E [Sphingobacterium multivorum]|uniref:serine hydrolase domain-containing protein n=1 Tax=Sphingobacterium multivorum TaxID=28454 RepID=UPI000DFBD14B|nr:serine hydrolase domain-containing protein [Sphingobacterium multivorum]QQT47144.1 beta-lactamase family protein [Sphingobacterium multivorum]SUJ87935.1 Penicillin-binding protein E [Sphingobacterium multivorum]
MINLKLSFILICVTSAVMGQKMDKSKLDSTIAGYYKDPAAPGISCAVSQNGRLIYRYAIGRADLKEKRAITSSSHFRLASVSKQVTAQAIYTLVIQKRLKLDDPLSLFFEDLSVALKGITVAQLLQHTSGIWDYEELIPKERKDQVSDKDVLKYIRQTDRLYFPSGSQFRYSNTGYCLLSLIVEHVAKKSFASFVKNHLFEPIGISKGLVYEPGTTVDERVYGYHPTEGSYLFADQSVTSATQGDGGVYLSADEYHTWANFLVKDRLIQPGLEQLFDQMAYPVKDGIAYHFGWFIQKNAGHKILFHSGESTGFHHIVYIDVQKDLVVSLFSNRDDLMIGEAFDAILKTMGISKPVLNGQHRSTFAWLNGVYANE